MMFFKLNPITKKRFTQFKKIKRGYYSLIILLALMFISLFSNYIGNSRAIIVSYEGKLYFPTFKFYEMREFGQEDEYGFDDAEVNYRDLKKEFQKSKGNWVLMPPVPYDPFENDFSYDEPPPNPPDSIHILGTDSQGRDVFVRLLYGFRLSIFFSLTLVFVSQIIGTIIGCLQGYLGGEF